MNPDGMLLVGRFVVSPWLYGPVLFALWVAVLLLAKTLVFRIIAATARRTGREMSLAFTSSLDVPLNLAIVVTGLFLLQRVLPLSSSVDQAAALVTRVALIAVGFLFAGSLTIHLLRFFQPRLQPFDVSKGIVPGLVRATLFVLGFVVILGVLGVPITPLVASLGVGSLAVALALQGPLSNIFAGLFLLADRSLNVGDFIELDSGEKGYIEQIGLRHTRIRMLPDNTVIVPNAKLIQSTIHNTHLPDQEISIRVQVGVHYDSDLRRVEEVTKEVGRRVQHEVEDAVPEWEPLVRYHTFDSSSINFTVVLRVREYVAGYVVKHEFIKALHERYRQEGIVIPFPLRTLDIQDSTVQKLRSVFASRERPGDAAD